jgi:hypothetical protein
MATQKRNVQEATRELRDLAVEDAMGLPLFTDQSTRCSCIPKVSPNGRFLYFRPIELLAQSFYSSLEQRLNAEPSRTGTTMMVTPSQGEPMKNAYEVLRQKETDLARVRHEIESLRIVASLLSDELPSEELTKRRARSAEEILDLGSEKATGTNGLFP